MSSPNQTLDDDSKPITPRGPNATILGYSLKLVRLFCLGLVYFVMTIFFAVYFTIFYRRKNNPWLYCRATSIPLLFLLGIKMRVRHMERLYTKQPCIYVANHQSNLDTMVTGRVFPKRTAVTGKKDIRRVPVFGYTFGAAGNFFVDRENHDVAMTTMRQIDQAIKNDGWSIWFFPEGTRSHGAGRLRRFKKGAFHCAIEAQVPIVPIVISSYISGLRLDRWRAANIIVDVLEPISTLGVTHEDSDKLVKSIHEKMLEAITALDAEAV